MSYDSPRILNPAGGGSFTFGTLPVGNAAVTIPPGTQAWTTDADLCTWSGSAWYSPQLYLRRRPFIPAGLKNVQQVMASPPTVAISTTNPLVSTGQKLLSTQNTASGTTASLANVAVTRARNPVVAGGVFPNYNYVNFSHVTAHGGLQNGGNIVQLSVVYTGSELVYVCKGVSGNIFCKVNDQYVSLSPTAVTNDGNTYYYSISFGSAGTYRIDILHDNVLDTCFFGGFWISPTDTLIRAQVRGRSICITGDSYTTSTGAGGAALGFPSVFAEYMGWDDVVPVGVGSTGLIVNGSYTNILSRLATDVYPYNFDDVIFAGFYNDNGQTTAAFQAAVSAAIADIQANLPDARITFFGPFAPYGVGYQLGNLTSGGFVGQRTALAAALAAANNPNILWVDPMTLPLGSSPQQTTLTSSPAANATTFTTAAGLVVGGHYQFIDGSRCRVLSVSGLTATVDRVHNTQASGTALVQVGPAYLTGNGYEGATTGVGNADLCVYTDDVHPSPAGHLQLGIILAEAYANYFNQ